eukprot:UN04057
MLYFPSFSQNTSTQNTTHIYTTPLHYNQAQQIVKTSFSFDL